MVRVFIEARDLFGCEPAAQSKDQIVERKLSFDLAMRDDHFSFEWIDVCDFGFDEVDSAVQHRVAQIECNICLVALAKSQPHERGVKDKLAAS